MGKIELVRTVHKNSKSTTLMVFKVTEKCNLSSVILKFANNETHAEIPLPDVEVNEGDFIWLNDLQGKELEALIKESNNNTSNTKTIVLVLKMPKLDLLDLKDY